jgi:tetratricopeptide (TPR) repeat protein
VGLAVALAIVCALPCAAKASQFLSAEIETALSERDGFLKRLDLAEGDFLSLKSWAASDEGGDVGRRLGALRGSGSPWYHYINGFVNGVDNRGAAERYFSAAVTVAGEDPGVLWLLAVEFVRNGEAQFADECLDAIEKYILTWGGSSAPLLSQQLILLGNAKAASDPEAAEYCYKSAKRFDKDQCWWLYRKAAIDFPQNVIATAPGFVTEACGLFAASWRAQVALLSGAYRLFAATLFIFVCAAFAVLTLKYLPRGVHPIGDTLFPAASPRARTASSIVIILAMLVVGIVPTLWVIAFLICRFLNAKEKKLLIFLCAILTLCPLNFLAQNFLSRGINQRSPAFLLDRSIREGYSDSLYHLAANLTASSDGYAAKLALAVSAIKSGDRKVSSGALNRVLELAPNDPLVRMYAGNYSFLTGDVEGMERYYGAVLNDNPRSAEAKFNLAQAYVNSEGFTASDMMSEAAKIDAALVGGHTRANARYFQEDVPPLRQILQPSLTPLYFWSRLFLADLSELSRFNSSKSYFGLSPLAAFGVSAAAMLLFLCLYSAMWQQEPRIKKYFTCRVCGRLLCRRCRKGTLCSVCYKESIDSHNNAAAMYNRQKAYQDRAATRKTLTEFALGAVFPGAGKLYKGETVFEPVTAMLTASAILAAFYCAVTFHTYYPSKAVIDPVYFVAALFLYNIIMFIKQCVWLAVTMKNKAKLSVRN